MAQKSSRSSVDEATQAQMLLASLKLQIADLRKEELAVRADLAKRIAAVDRREKAVTLREQAIDLAETSIRRHSDLLAL